MEFRFLAFWVVLDTWIGKVQRQIRCFLHSLYQKPLYLSIRPTLLFWKSEKQVWKVRTTHRPLAPPEVRRLKRFATQNLGAGGIYFRRACPIKRAPESRQTFGNLAKRRCGILVPCRCLLKPSWLCSSWMNNTVFLLNFLKSKEGFYYGKQTCFPLR